MASSPVDKAAPIAIIGAGVFGLSSAIHLVKRGYKNVTVFDRQPYHETHYDFDRGCDAASADCNKIIRAAYGHETWYQNLTLEAIKVWESWNDTLATGAMLPPGMTRDERIYVNCGNYHFGDHGDAAGLNPFEKASVENITKAGLGHTQYLFASKPEEAKRAKKDGYGYAVDPFHLSGDGQPSGYLDMIGGFVYADKACRYALHLAQQLGVNLVLDRQAGSFEGFVEDSTGTVTGIRTTDGKQHPASLTIVACGGWTPSLLPEMDGLCETTAGSVAMIQIPSSSPLRQRFSATNFPVFQWNVRSGENGNLYGFPLDDRGVLKIGYRGTKYTHPQVQSDGHVRSTPITKWTSPFITGLPEKSATVIQSFLDRYIPELKAAGIGISQTRLCWYTDSYDNHWVIDQVPDKKGVIVATGGSGHAFKFLPVLGQLVADRVEGVQSELLKLLQWRKLGKDEKGLNELMRGFEDRNALQKVKMVDDIGRGSKL
ncbi:FAD dependent oxidoreductase [Aspergillus sclerotioniger CBS 115572]|uniref:FAD dependent oxidoreductase n=1 Tax=Aspergillus sclerotioniger CBS 115572 TaxID=1450535 RepID=A0A317WYK0_9EURO|nr:FAD dependent oxidoreductase [Aspergillus sclerotioniger CBS 115572]PWY90337.1 FAD dependent oxidoreductase [Aspergillus sclerotioniger CBS 115572]